MIIGVLAKAIQVIRPKYFGIQNPEFYPHCLEREKMHSHNLPILLLMISKGPPNKIERFLQDVAGDDFPRNL